MIKTYKVNDEMAGLVPMAIMKEQETLNADVAKAGKVYLPIVLWREEIIDGRCRQVAAIAAGVELPVIRIPDETPRDEVAAMVRSLNSRRNLTMTQKAMSALKQQQTFGGTNDEVAKSCGIGGNTFKDVKYIANFSTTGVNMEYLGTTTPIEDLFNGSSLHLVKEPTTTYSNKVATIGKYLRKQNVEEIYEQSKASWVDVRDDIDTDQGRDWLDAKLNIYGHTMPIGMRRDLAELANFKFPLNN